MKQIDLGQISTLCGRFSAMDPDTNWERIKAARSCGDDRKKLVLA